MILFPRNPAQGRIPGFLQEFDRKRRVFQENGEIISSSLEDFQICQSVDAGQAWTFPPLLRPGSGASRPYR